MKAPGNSQGPFSMSNPLPCKVTVKPPSVKKAATSAARL